MDGLSPYANLAGRILLALIFILSGIGKIFDYGATSGYMEAFGVPGILLPLVIVVEVVGGILIAIGFLTRPAALALAGFTLVAAVIFHSNLGEQIEMIMFMKNLSITGGLLLLVARGAGALALDNRRTASNLQSAGA